MLADILSVCFETDSFPVADIGVCPEYIASVCFELDSDIFATIGPIPRESAQAFVHALYPVSFG